jgi:hypothetical protein
MAMKEQPCVILHLRMELMKFEKELETVLRDPVTG